MSARVHIFCIVLVGTCLTLSNAIAKTASCPCNPCKCSPCTCGAGGPKSSSHDTGKHHDDVAKHHDREHGHDHHGGSSVGVGVNVDLGGVGQRHAEADPFAAGGGEKPVAHTQERHESKRKEHEPSTTSFDQIKLTGVEGKGDMPPPNTFNVDNDQVEQPELGGGKTKEKETGDAKTEKTLTKEQLDELDNALRDYWHGLFALEDKMTVDLKALREDLKTLERQKSPKLKKKAKEYNDFLKKLEDAFYKSDAGKKAFDAWMKTYEKFYNTGAKIPKWGVPTKAHPFFSPYVLGDDMTNKKYALDEAERKLESEKSKYQQMQKDAVSNNDSYQKLQAGPDKDKAGQEIAKEWASTNDAKEQMKKVQEAEKAYDDAKQAFKPYEQLTEEKTKAAAK